jgi:hypothetical protein
MLGGLKRRRIRIDYTRPGKDYVDTSDFWVTDEDNEKQIIVLKPTSANANFSQYHLIFYDIRRKVLFSPKCCLKYSCRPHTYKAEAGYVAMYVCFALKEKVGKDPARLIAQFVFETSDDHSWNDMQHNPNFIQSTLKPPPPAPVSSQKHDQNSG